jgi:hypothetical protein
MSDLYTTTLGSNSWFGFPEVHVKRRLQTLFSACLTRPTPATSLLVISPIRVINYDGTVRTSHGPPPLE